MAYLSGILACRKAKDPVKLYIDITASDQYAYLAEEIAKSVTLKLQEKYRAYLSKYAGFAGKQIVYADNNPDHGTKEHEKWHNYLEAKKANPAAGEFIEEASAHVIDDIVTGNYHRHLGLSRNFFIPTYLLAQKTEGQELEKIIANFGQRLPEWDEKAMKGSCLWLKFIDDAKYFMLYDLCFDICARKGLKAAKRVYTTALEKTKKSGIEKGMNHLRNNASEAISSLYDFEFDIGGYFPNYIQLADYSFFSGDLQIEVCGAYKEWMRPLDAEIKKRSLHLDEIKS